MNTIRTILATTDLSGPARHAVERAAWLARERSGSHLTICHVFSLSALESIRRMVEPGAGDLERSLLAEAELSLGKLAHELEQRHGTAPATRLSVGRALDEIPAAAEELDADLLAMGARGAHFVRELLLGSTTERVLRRTRRPVLAVKQPPHEPYRRVLVPVDFSEYSVPALRLAQAVAPGAEITLLHAFEVELEGRMRFAGVTEDVIRHYLSRARQGATEGMQALLARLGPGPFAPAVVHGPATTCILEAEQNTGADLIVMGKHGQSVMEELLIGSVTKHLLAHSACDVLVSGGRE
jgi:nucleotide-binding universal stress UspA family protein